jgi:hypothetical protein
MLTSFAVGVLLIGLALDMVSIYLWWRWRKQGGARPGVLPLVPWLFYFLSAFFLFLLAKFAIAGLLLLTMTFWHIGLIVFLRRALSHPQPSR